jgi:hypothetical protein
MMMMMMMKIQEVLNLQQYRYEDIISRSLPDGFFLPPFLPTAQKPLVGQDLTIIQASRSHSDTPHLVESLFTDDRPVADFYLTPHNTHKGKTSMPPGGNRTSNLRRQAAVLKATRHNYKQVRRKFLVCRQF